MTEPPVPEPNGSLRPTSTATLAAWAVVGLAGGWLLHPLSERANGTAPIVSWLQPLTLLLVAVILGLTAHATWRAVHGRRERLLPHQAVNRLLLARACAYVGALAAGGYLGYGLSWVGSNAELADERLWPSLSATVAGILMVVAALLLERACRVPDDDPKT